MVVEGPKTPGGPVSRETQARDVAVDGREPVCLEALRSLTTGPARIDPCRSLPGFSRSRSAMKPRFT